jgi:hypothetical protein
MSKPFSSGKRAKFYTMNAGTAARKIARRRAGKVRPAKSGGQKRRRAVSGRWMRGWPEQRTEKQGKNKGKAPRFTSAVLAGDHGQRPPPPGQAWPWPDNVQPKEMR